MAFYDFHLLLARDVTSSGSFRFTSLPRTLFCSVLLVSLSLHEFESAEAAGANPECELRMERNALILTFTYSVYYMDSSISICDKDMIMANLINNVLEKFLFQLFLAHVSWENASAVWKTASIVYLECR